jgi:hypothetical protein
VIPKPPNYRELPKIIAEIVAEAEARRGFVLSKVDAQ